MNPLTQSPELTIELETSPEHVVLDPEGTSPTTITTTGTEMLSTRNRPGSWNGNFLTIEELRNRRNAVLSACSNNTTTTDTTSTITRDSSANSSLISESVVDANKAGILLFGNGQLLEESQSWTGKKEETTSLRSSSSLANNLPSMAHREGTRVSAHTDPGPGLSTESYMTDSASRSAASYGHAIVGENHVNFVLMYDMLTGIRHAVSVCQAKPNRPLSLEDFRYARTYNFLPQAAEMTPSRYEFRFKDYCPWVFRGLREAFRIDAADYLVSLTGKYVLSEIGSPGKSGSLFYFSQDFRYIIKTIRPNEHAFLRKILRSYYEHVRRNPNSLLTRFYGLHRVRMSGLRGKIYFVVMGNVFPAHKDIHETFDLKGSTRGRYITADEIDRRPLATLKDLNWLQKRRKLRLGPEKATLLMNQLKADCYFLAKMRIMDYSLLVGIHHLSRGNRENLRERSMKVLEPTTAPVRLGKGIMTTFRQTNLQAAPSTDPIPQERRMCIFYSEDGGFGSSHRDGTPGEELYFLGVIDILTPWGTKKRLEHLFRSIRENSQTISAVNPQVYCKRFLNFMSENILQDTDSDYATKQLPQIPGCFSTLDAEEDDALVIVEDEEKKLDELDHTSRRISGEGALDTKHNKRPASTNTRTKSFIPQ